MNNNCFDKENHNINHQVPFSSNHLRTANGNLSSEGFIFNLLKKNIGKIGTFYFTYPDSVTDRDKSFKGVLEDVGHDYILISDSTSGKWYLFVLFFLDYVEFEEEVYK